MPDSTAIKINDEIAALVAGALDGGNAIIVAAVSRDEKPLVSIRGSVALFGDDQLSFWARNAEGGTIEAIRANSAVSLLYRGPGVPLLQFIGRAGLPSRAPKPTAPSLCRTSASRNPTPTRRAWP